MFSDGSDQAGRVSLASAVANVSAAALKLVRVLTVAVRRLVATKVSPEFAPNTLTALASAPSLYLPPPLNRTAKLLADESAAALNATRDYARSLVTLVLCSPKRALNHSLYISPNASTCVGPCTGFSTAFCADGFAPGCTDPGFDLSQYATRKGTQAVARQNRADLTVGPCSQGRRPMACVPRPRRRITTLPAPSSAA